MRRRRRRRSARTAPLRRLGSAPQASTSGSRAARRCPGPRAAARRDRRSRQARTRTRSDRSRPRRARDGGRRVRRRARFGQARTSSALRWSDVSRAVASRARNVSRPRCRRDFIAGRLRPSACAVAAPDRPWTSRSTTTARCSAGRRFGSSRTPRAHDEQADADDDGGCDQGDDDHGGGCPFGSSSSRCVQVRARAHEKDSVSTSRCSTCRPASRSGAISAALNPNPTFRDHSLS